MLSNQPPIGIDFHAPEGTDFRGNLRNAVPQLALAMRVKLRQPDYKRQLQGTPASATISSSMTNSLSRVFLFVTITLLLAGAGCSLDSSGWVGTWSASSAPSLQTGLEFENETVREIVRASVGGKVVRITLSNLYGNEPLVIAEVQMAISNGGSSILSGSERSLTFGGSPSCSIPAGATLTSDPLKMSVSAATNVAISLYLPMLVSSPTTHPIALQTTYIAQGNHTGDADLAADSTITSWAFLTRVEVKATDTAASIVALGDSLTDGFASTADSNHRWTDILSNRLNSSHGIGGAVLNAGLSGNRILHSAPDGARWYGDDALDRFGRDVLSQAGVKYIFALEGINDIGLPGYIAPISQHVTAAEIIGGLQQLIQQAHSRDLKIYGATLTPFEDATYPGYYTPQKEVEREAVNDWLRGANPFDAVIDFDQVLRDPTHPTRLLPLYDSGDHLHPNDAGYAAMGDAIDLRLLQ